MSTRAFIRTRTFGRRAVPIQAAVSAPPVGIANDVKLFAMTFMGGFLFMTVYLA